MALMYIVEGRHYHIFGIRMNIPTTGFVLIYFLDLILRSPNFVSYFIVPLPFQYYRYKIYCLDVILRSPIFVQYFIVPLPFQYYSYIIFYLFMFGWIEKLIIWVMDGDCGQVAVMLGLEVVIVTWRKGIGRQWLQQLWLCLFAVISKRDRMDTPSQLYLRIEVRI